MDVHSQRGSRLPLRRRRRRGGGKIALAAAVAAVMEYSSSSPPSRVFVAGACAFVGNGGGVPGSCSPNVRWSETCSSDLGSSSRARLRQQQLEWHGRDRRSSWVASDRCRRKQLIGWSPVPRRRCRSSRAFLMSAGNDARNDDDEDDEGDISRQDDEQSLSDRGRNSEPVPNPKSEDGGVAEKGLDATESEQNEGDDGVSITDDQLSGLYGRISAMRERDVELDRVCAHNWRQGTCSHDLLFQASDAVQHVAWSGDELAFGTDGGGTWIISRSTGQIVNVFEGHDGDVTALFFDGHLLISGGGDKTVRVQRNRRNSLENEQLGECLHVLTGHTERVTGVARLGKDRIASASVDGTLRLWDLETGKVLHELILPSPVYSLGAVDGYLVTGLMDGNVIAWEARNPEAPPRDILKLEAHHGAVSAISFPSKDVLLTGGGDGRVKFWDLANGGEPIRNLYEIDGQSVTHAFKGHAAPVCAVQGNEHRVVSAAVDGTVAVWDLRSGKELFQMYGHQEGIRSLQFDREYLITDGTGENVFLHDFTGRRGVPATIGKTDPKDRPPFGDRDGDEEGEGGGGGRLRNRGSAGNNPGWGGAGLFGLGGNSENGIEDFPEGDEPGFGRPRGDAGGY